MKGVLTFITIVLLFMSFPLAGQIEHGGTPYSLEKAFVKDIKEKQLPSFDIEAFIQKIKASPNQKKLPFARMFDMNINLKKASSVQRLSSGNLYLYSVSSPRAHSLQVIFSQLEIPDGAKLFAYNPYSGHIIGAFTSENNKKSRRLALSPVKGDKIIIEYFEPHDAPFNGKLVIGQVGHGVLNIYQATGKETAGIGDAGECNRNVVCPEGEGWEDAKQSIARLITGGYLCTGVLMNNTNFDGRPYMLTANHCIDDESIADDAIFQFNLESPECDTTYYNENIQSISGAKLISTAPENKLDFALVELSEPVPVAYEPFYAGWSLDTTNITNTTCIHHPSGDLKKITKDFEPPVTDNYGAGYDQNTHWRVKEWDVGTTEGGSSGSPLFNQYQQVIGDLTGGEASCDYNRNDFYQKFSVSWDAFGEEEHQMEHWLDINETGFNELGGFKPYEAFPSNLRVISKNSTNRLKWNVIKEYSTVSYYEIFRNGNKTGTTTETTFIDDVPVKDSLYFYQVRAYKTDDKYTGFSKSVGVIPVMPRIIPYDYSFETSSFKDSAWYNFTLQGTGEWVIDSSGAEIPADGDNYARFSGVSGTKSRLISRKLDLGVSKYVILNYDVGLKENQSNVDELGVFIRYADSLPWKRIYHYDRKINGWLEESLYLPKPTNNYQVMFEAISHEGGGIYLDDIRISNDPDAIEPSFSATQLNICNTDSIVLSLDTVNVFNSYHWDMGYGAEPRYIEGYGPHEVKYTYPGSKTVKLTINGKYQKVNEDYITVWEVPDPSIITQGDSLISNYDSGNQWLRDGDSIQDATSPVYIVKEPGTFRLKVTNQNGCTGVSEEIVINNVGFDDPSDNELKYNIYPNPVDDNLVIEKSGRFDHSGHIYYRVFNVTGSMVISGNLVHEKQTLSTANLHPGIYFLRIDSEKQGSYTHTFVKE